MISNMMFPSVILVVRLSSNRPIDSAQIVFSNLTLFNLSYTRYTDTLTILLFQLAPIISVSCQCDNIDAILTGNFDAGSAIVEESSIGTQQPNCSCTDDHSGFGFFNPSIPGLVFNLQFVVVLVFLPFYSRFGFLTLQFLPLSQILVVCSVSAHCTVQKAQTRLHFSRTNF